ncbi:hypothetical protein EV426DRAFT_682024 [Tirmania nivea]|nr:hypothetical protein EV426DRAFT_682024 [Tirmania nivea]
MLIYYVEPAEICLYPIQYILISGMLVSSVICSIVTTSYENEEQFDRWEEEQRIEKFKRMGKREWEQVGMFLLQHTMCFLKDTFFDTELSVVETILGGEERRTGLAQTFDTTHKEWEGQVYESDTDETRLVEEERIIGGLKDEILCLSKERDILDTELSHLKQTLVAFADQGC